MIKAIIDRLFLWFGRNRVVEKIPRQNEFFKGKITEVYDGDTCTVVYRYGTKLVRTNIRIKGIDAPEVKGKGVEVWESEAGIKVRDIVRKLILRKTMTVQLVKFDKYGGRTVGDVFLRKNYPLSLFLLSKGLAKNYEGGKKVPWTKKECDKISSLPY